MKRVADPPSTQSLGRLMAGVLATACLPAVVLIDAFLAVQRGWRPENTLERALIAMAGLVLVGVFVSILLPRGRKWLACRAPQLALALASGLLALAICEVAVRIWLPAPLLHTRTPGYQQTFTPDSTVLKGLSSASNYSINSLGLRGPEPSDVRLSILCVGGTTTECVYLDDSKTWPRQLMAALNQPSPDERVWVANAGHGSLATGHHLQFLQQSPLISEFDYIIFLPGLNDLLRTLHGLDSNNTAGPLFGELALLDLVQRVWNGHLGMGLIADSTGTKLTLLRRLLPVTEDYVVPDLKGSIEAYRGRLNELIDECVRMKKKPVFVTQPLTGSTKLRRRLDLAEARNVDLLAEMIAQYNRTLLDVCAERGVDVVDLSSMTGVDRYFCDHYNFSEAGAAEVARLIAEHLRPQLAVESPDRDS